MFLAKAAGKQVFQQFTKGFVPQSVRTLHHLSVHHNTPEEIQYRYKCFFERQDIDGWDIRQGMNDLMAFDSIPEPAVIIAALYACRRNNDYSLTVRFLEAVKNKCGPHVNKIFPYIVDEIAPVVHELGCDFPKDLGYDKPEFYYVQEIS